jgi:hypothetical protein
MKNRTINKTFSFQNNLGPFRVGAKQIIFHNTLQWYLEQNLSQSELAHL